MDFIDDESDEDLAPQDVFLNNLCQEGFKFILRRRASQKSENVKMYVLIICDTDSSEVSTLHVNHSTRNRFVPGSRAN